ncbi:hypothetical protein EZV62_023362 [Acer yangbiense]|uniref:SPARK domain-containing protein n=1 Tax=Acer yangbiense TaxID=1000413 RepID=A0A5C7H1D8_9ROSI|nr:hypothetical protein EZV62_023362 [Acer yangbiense]
MYTKFPLFLFLFFFSTLSRVPILYSLPDPETIQPLLVTQSPPATIPAFPEQSNIAGCPLDLPEELFHGVKSACAATKDTGVTGELRRSRCCPVLATWLYSAYSATALGRAVTATPAAAYDMPLLPDDSETCVDDLGKALKQRGIELARPNQTCDMVYCFCGIRLHPLSCPEAFSVNRKGKLVGNKNVKRLERDCLSSRVDVNGFPGLGGCNKCLKTLYLLNSNKTSNSSKSEDRTTKMHNKDCQLMGLTWLLARNRTAYIHTVSAVIRAMMMNTDGSDPQSCTLSSDGMPLAVDSSDIYNQSSAITLPVPIYLSVVSAFLLLAFFFVVSSSSRL